MRQRKSKVFILEEQNYFGFRAVHLSKNAYVCKR